MTTLTVDKVKKAGPGRHGDGHGLYLVVTPAGSRQWVQRITVDGKRMDKGLGGFPTVSLSEARKEAETNRAAVKRGENPFTMPKRERKAKEAQEAAPVPTFREVALMEHRRITAATGQTPTTKRWLERLESHVFPSIGGTLVSDIDRAKVAEILNPLRATHAETARKLKQEMFAIFDFSASMNWRSDNPADKVCNRLLNPVKARVEHREALPHAEVRNAVQKIRNSEAKRSTRLAFQFLVLTATRSAEVRFATWGEIDREAKTWTIPAARMKAKRDHVIPLSIQAQAILQEARNLWPVDSDSDIGWAPEIPADGFIFPHPHSFDRLSENCFSDRAKKDNLGCVPHGFRSSFRDWAADSGAYTWEAIELSLAHTIGSTVSQAYFRTALLDQRAPMMQAWADYVDPSPAPF